VLFAVTASAEPVASRPVLPPGNIGGQSTLPAVRAADPRPHLNEYRLRDINTQLETDRPASPALPTTAEPDLSGNPAKLLTRTTTATLESDLRGSLHRLRRETREQNSPHTRKHPIDESLDP
jgi:hypothetical protein